MRAFVRYLLASPHALPPALPPSAVFCALIQAGDALTPRLGLQAGTRVELLREASSVAFEEGALFPPSAIREGLNALVMGALQAGEGGAQAQALALAQGRSALPLLLMRALQLAALKVADMRPAVAQLLSLVTGRLGGGAFEPLGVLQAGGGEARAPVWEGYVRLVKIIVDLALPALPELPPAHLQCLLQREGDLRKRFAKWLPTWQGRDSAQGRAAAEVLRVIG